MVVIIYDRKIMSTREDKFRQMRVRKKKQTTKILVSDVGFEPTPTYVDQERIHIYHNYAKLCYVRLAEWSKAPDSR
jgi:hypothetical protein